MTVPTPSSGLDARLARLEDHLERENPILLDVVRSFRRLDEIAYRLGLLERDESFATQVTWWPVVSCLGTFSSGKSTFINSYLGERLQPTGNQAVDDKFTVICYGPGQTPRVLPGLALDSDPRFSFYRISHDIEAVTPGEGRRLDVYLQLKTSHNEKLKGKILIDSPGFDADAQRTATLRITDHIIDLSDLVLVFFDARHPEPGAMQDTLKHLVADTLNRPDFNKFIYVLNQIDNAAREDNPEEVFAAWQRALAQKGLTAGRFYRIYDPGAAVPIENENLRRRFEAKREADVKEILDRMHQVEVERAYRVTGALEKTAKTIRDELVPRIEAAKRIWKKRVLWFDAVAFAIVLAAILAGTIYLGYWDAGGTPSWWQAVTGSAALSWTMVGLVVLLAVFLHIGMSRLAARTVVAGVRRHRSPKEKSEWVANGVRKNTRWWKVFSQRPAGWSYSTRSKLGAILAEADRIVQNLNDRFASPSGELASETERRDRFEEASGPKPAPVAFQKKEEPVPSQTAAE